MKKKNSNIFGVLKPYKWYIAVLVLVTVLNNGLGLIIPKITAAGIDAFNKGHFQMDQSLLRFGVVIAGIFVLSYLQSVMQTLTAETAARDLRMKLINKISGQSFSYIQQETPGKLLTNLTSDIDAIKQFVSMAVASLISSVFLIIGASTLLLITNWQLALAVLAIVPLIGIIFFSIMGRIRPLFRKTQEIIDVLNRVINESIWGATLIRVLNSQEQEIEKFFRINTEAKNNSFKILGYFAILIPIISFVAGVASIVILTFGGHLIILNKMTLGDLTAFNSYLGMLIFPVILLGFMSNVIARSGASYERIVSVLNAKVEKETGTIAAPLKGKIDFKKVWLKYGQKYVLKDVSMTVSAGSRTAIIGPTAAGKTQLLYLLSGLVKPDKGEVRYDDRKLKDYDQKALHQQVGYVFQDSIIFNMSLRENISFNQKVDEIELQKAIETAELEDFVNDLPQKLETIVSERGSSLSGGQKQRIMLARALAINPKILLLDDFTARVDTRTEQKIMANVLKNYPEVTIVSITQKITSVEDYDQIIMLMEGEIIGAGTHETLLKTTPEYVQLYNSQKSTQHYELPVK